MTRRADPTAGEWALFVLLCLIIAGTIAAYGPIVPASVRDSAHWAGMQP